MKQGDALSAVLFNLVLQYETRNINKGSLRTHVEQVILYAGKVKVITKRRKILIQTSQGIVK